MLRLTKQEWGLKFPLEKQEEMRNRTKLKRLATVDVRYSEFLSTGAELIVSEGCCRAGALLRSQPECDGSECNY
jgi:hypothetical protein